MPKSMNYAILEAIQGEMRRDKLLTLLYEYQGTAARWRGKSVDLEAEFGPPRVQFCPIDEEWIVGGALGMSLIGVRAIAHIPSMATFIPFELMFNHAGKLRHMTGGQAEFPMVLWADMARRWARQGGQHADAGKPYDGKGEEPEVLCDRIILVNTPD